MALKLFFQVSTSKWCNRIDRNTRDSAADADNRDEIARAFGVRADDVGIVRLLDAAISPGDAELLTQAADWLGTPPGDIPTPSDVVTGNRINPIPVPLTRLEELIGKLIDDSLTLPELKEMLRLERGL